MTLSCCQYHRGCELHNPRVFSYVTVFLSDVTNAWCYDGPFRREQKKRIPFVQYIVDCRSRTTRIRAVLNMTQDSNTMDNQYLYFKRG